MKPLALLSLLLCAGCADKFYYPNGQVAAVLMSDRTHEILAFSRKSMTYSADVASHSAVAKVHWHGAIALGGEAAGAALGFHGGTQALGEATSIITASLNRPTTRQATPVPISKP